MFSFHPVLFGLLAAVCSLQKGAAGLAVNLKTRSTDVTCGGQYPRAGDGYGQRPDGCSSWSDNPAQVRDKWGSANFGGVCDDHDRCYYTIGANVDDCNQNFCSGLRKACHKAYCKKVLGVDVCEPVTYGGCTAIAGTYCLAVKSVAAGVYAEAQKLQTGYEQCIAEHGGIAPPQLCSNGRAEGSRWEDTSDGMRCTRTWYACRDGKIVPDGEDRISPCIEF